jgi:hypothetical protein
MEDTINAPINYYDSNGCLIGAQSGKNSPSAIQ